MCSPIWAAVGFSLLNELDWLNLSTGVKRLAKLGLVNSAPGMAALDMNSAEDAVVNHTREVVPGMVICGMEVLPRASCCI